MASLQATAREVGARLMRLMRLQASHARLRGRVHAGATVATLPPRAMRACYHLTRCCVDGQAVYTIAPREGAGDRHVYYLHGGAYVAGFAKQHWQFLGRLVAGTHCTVTAPDYPLAPEHHVDDVFALVLPLYEELVARVDPATLTLMGDSSGGGMALALAQQLRDRGVAQPANIVLLSPWLDLTMTNPEIDRLQRVDAILNPAGLIDAARRYVGETDARDPRVSPLYGSLKGLSRLNLWIGTHDVFLADCQRLREKAAAEGVSLRYHEYEGMSHVWILLSVSLPEAKRAMREILAVVRAG